MEGKSVGELSDTLHYAVRLTFGVVHGVILTLGSYWFALTVPFALLGCVIAPLLSLLLTLLSNFCIQYVITLRPSLRNSLSSVWVPPLGIFCGSLLLLPLEMMPTLGYNAPVSTLIATSIVVNFLLAVILQLYAARQIQSSASDSDS